MMMMITPLGPGRPLRNKSDCVLAERRRCSGRANGVVPLQSTKIDGHPFACFGTPETSGKANINIRIIPIRLPCYLANDSIISPDTHTHTPLTCPNSIVENLFKGRRLGGAAHQPKI